MSYRPEIYKFLYNILCLIAETWLFTDVDPVISGQTVCFLFYKNTNVSHFEAYRAINFILNNNVCNFFDRYGADFNQHFNKGLRLLRVRLMDDSFFTFGVN